MTSFFGIKSKQQRMATAIKVENLSKMYELGEVATGTLVNDFSRFMARMRGKEDPFLKIGETNDRTVAGGGQFVLSLNDISFEIEQGDAVGIIGRNGAGKSTLLKILSRVTAPTKGLVKMRGRIASLLEVGTGFHPDLTGRENIFLNGAILGMRKAEIKQKLDEIVDFSGVARYIDTPVKRYSSGMYVRLAFAVAAYLESEILIVDEVLAVGDAEFQKKCLGKMKEVSKGEGRTVLFVSHQLNTINSLCNRCILLDKGSIERYDSTAKVIAEYLKFGDANQNSWVNDGASFKFSQFEPLRFCVVDAANQPATVLPNNELIGIYIEGAVELLEPGFSVGFAVYDGYNNLLFWSLNTDKEQSQWIQMSKGVNKLIGWIKPHTLNEGEYRVELITAVHFKEWLCRPEHNAPVIYFSIQGGLSKSPQWMQARPGIMAPVNDFEKL
ncbi:MAG: transporter, ATP-binding protein [Mucilaginibacter sp.]|nr:transporter, ATP-binding protein [Mucilaginibacter sp.]